MATTGILMIHGTFGSPMEYSGLVQTLESHGYLTRCVTLPGHGDSPSKRLGEVDALEMIDHCLQEYEHFSQQCDRVVILGHSLGGLCSLIIATEVSHKLGAVISFGTPYEHAFFVNYPWGFLDFDQQRFMEALKYAPQGYTGLGMPLFMPWWFPRLYREATFMLDELKFSLPRLTVPVLLGHSPYDMIVPYAEMEKIANSIGKPHLVTMHTFQQCGHQIFPTSQEQENAIRLIMEFMNRLQDHQSGMPLSA